PLTAVLETLALHDALPISPGISGEAQRHAICEHGQDGNAERLRPLDGNTLRELVVGLERQVGVLLGRAERQDDAVVTLEVGLELDRKRTRLNSSHLVNSYA